jgi:hypothetical protein
MLVIHPTWYLALLGLLILSSAVIGHLLSEKYDDVRYFAIGAYGAPFLLAMGTPYFVRRV